MSDEKINKVISEAESIIKNFDRFYHDKLYIDNDVPEVIANAENVQVIENMPPKKKKSEVSGVTVKDKAAVAEIDIFGNENIKREEWEFSETLEELNEKIKNCKKCDLWKTRTNFVFGCWQSKG
jgi:hypothetical protein